MMRRGHLTGDHTDTDGSGYKEGQPSVLTKVKPGKLEGTVALDEPVVANQEPVRPASTKSYEGDFKPRVPDYE